MINVLFVTGPPNRGKHRSRQRREELSLLLSLCPSVIHFFCLLISLALSYLFLCFIHCSHWEQLLLSTKPLDALDIRYDRWVRAVKEWYCPPLHYKVCLPAGKKKNKKTKRHRNDETQIHSTWVLKGSLLLFISRNKRLTKYFMYSIHKTRAPGF